MYPFVSVCIRLYPFVSVYIRFCIRLHLPIYPTLSNYYNFVSVISVLAIPFYKKLNLFTISQGITINLLTFVSMEVFIRKVNV